MTLKAVIKCFLKRKLGKEDLNHCRTCFRIFPYLKQEKIKNTISSSEEKDTVTTLFHLPKLALMIGPRTDTQFTGGSATWGPLTSDSSTTGTIVPEKFKWGPKNESEQVITLSKQCWSYSFLPSLANKLWKAYHCCIKYKNWSEPLFTSGPWTGEWVSDPIVIHTNKV